MKTRFVLVGVGLLVAGAVAFWLLRSEVPAGELTELVADGGEHILRDPMRPPQPGTRVLVIALDGVGDDDLRGALRTGAMPRLAALLGTATNSPDVWDHGYATPGVLSILPSTTFAAWSSIFTGEPPSRTGIPGNEWFARETMEYFAPAPVSVTGLEHSLEVYNDDLVGRVLAVPTLYERLDRRSYVILASVHRGADLLASPSPDAFGELVAAAASGIVEDETSPKQEAYEELDRNGAGAAVSAMQQHGVPDLQVLYFPGVDLYTHVAPQPLADQQRHLREVVDPALGELFAEYRAQGVLDSTYIVIVSDHGHTPVLDDDRHALGSEGDDEPPALLERTGFRVRPFTAETDDTTFQATVAYQGAIAYVYLADRSTCAGADQRCDWTRPPRLEEDVLAVARAFDAANRTGAVVPQLRGTLDLIFAREPRAPGVDAAPFQVWDGMKLVPIDAWLAANPRPDLVALKQRLDALAAGPYGHRAGDVLLLARSGGDRPIEDRFYFSGRYRSWHGSPSAQDSRVPLLVIHPSRSGAELEAAVRGTVGTEPSQLDVVPLILSLFSAGR